jgi:hypothetical protein
MADPVKRAAEKERNRQRYQARKSKTQKGPESRLSETGAFSLKSG